MTMIVWAPRFPGIALVVFWYWPTPRWKVWRGYQWGIVGRRWPTIYAGPLKIVTGPAA
jgi:hypothetical protein